MLDVPVLRVGKADHRRCRDVRTGGDHRLDIPELQRAVLHLEPGSIVMLCRLAIRVDIDSSYHKAAHLLAVKHFLLADAVQFGLGFGLTLAMQLPHDGNTQ